MNFKIKSDTYYIMCIMCLLFVMSKYEYTEAELNARLLCVLILGIVFAIIAFIKSTK
jgi:hypothetical protein